MCYYFRDIQLNFFTMETKNQLIRKKFGLFFLIFCLVTFLIWFIFPHQLVGNIYVLMGYLVGNLIFLYVLYKYKRSLNKVE
ncbi:hypothetical protein CKY20_09955 [Capnocytophaga canis]|uniref:Uncharacterized protein n=2 Tax=Capnocytophaga canis TaxID=1848903 RepID=A0A3A1YBI2_9FLAO|nr:hypothetical protein CGC52_05780 [Capnocytophaga sp. H2931]RIY35492.1 hypothetical protein CKY20_09955 [Capnocytophaga canis]